MNAALWWIRRDLRLEDNQALAAALKDQERVVPVFVLDPQLLESSYASQQRLAFLFDGLRGLDERLRQRGSALIVRKGDPLEVLHTLLAETGAVKIFAEADVSPYARRRDTRITRELPLSLTPGLTVFPPENMRKADGSPYTVFTPFSKMWRSLPFPGKPVPAPEQLPPVPGLASAGIPTRPVLSASISFQAGEVEAQRRLEAFMDGSINRYADDRNRMDLEGTSTLSPYLRFGMLSARKAAWTALQAEAMSDSTTARRGAETWLNELIWREFYTAILYHFPYARRMAFQPRFRDIAWRNDPKDFAVWREGRTGYPVVDAAMRQLNFSGWMHNRARMIAASFLVKDLLIDWRWGEQYFMQHLIDGDPAANNGGWQWTAGTGTDAAPYFRVFNPVLQGMKFDPNGAYVRQWVSELERVPDTCIHEPWKMDHKTQVEAGCIIGKDYPAPILEHAMARQRTLAVFRR